MKHKDIRWTYKNITKLMSKEIDLGVIPTAKYSQKDHLKVLLSAAVENTSAESISDEVEGFPSADTVLGNLRQQNWEVLKRGFEEIIKYTIKMAKHRRWFSRPVTLAVDFHDDLYYGKVDNEWIISVKPQKGTSHAFRVATIDIVEYGKRFCLAWLPVKRGMRRAEVLRELIKRARRYVKIRYLLLDGGFYRVEVVKFLQDQRIKFIMRAVVQSKKIKGIIKTSKDKDIQLEHIIRGKRGDCAIVQFVSHYNPNKNERFNYVTNTDLGHEAISSFYSKRWGIETSYRVKGKFEANTTSDSEVIRFTYLLISICLYNVWVLVNLLIDKVVIKLIECSEMGGKKYSPTITTRKLKRMYSRWLSS